MFDDFLRERADGPRRAVRPVRPGRRLRRVRRRQAALRRGALVPRRRAGSSCPRAAADDPPDAETVARPRQPQERARAQADPRARASRPTRARCATSRPPATPACARAVVSSSANCRDVLAAAGHRRTCSSASSTASSPSASTCAGKPAPDTFLAGARALGVEPAQAAVFEDALAGVEAGRAGAFGFVVGVDRVGQADALEAHGADVVVDDLAELLDTVIQHPAFPVEPWAVRETELDLDRLAQTESVFALSNGHIGLRGNLDEGEPYGLPGHLPRRLLRAATAALRRGRLRLPGGRARRSSTSPTARSSACSSTTSRSTSATARCAATSACSTCAPACCAARPSGSRRPGGRCASASTRLVSFDAARGRGDPLRGRAARRAVRGRRPVGAGRQRGAAATPEPTRARAAALAAPLAGGVPRRRRHRARCSCTARRRAGCGSRPAMDHDDRRRRRAPRRRSRAFADLGAADGRPPTLEPGEPLRLVKFARLRLVGASARCRPLRDQVAAALAEARAHRLGRAAGGSSARTSTTSGSAPTSRSRATPSSSRRCASRCSTCCRRAPAPSSARSPPRA